MANNYDVKEMYDDAVKLAKKVDFSNLNATEKSRFLNALGFGAKDFEKDFKKLLLSAIKEYHADLVNIGEGKDTDKFLSGNALYKAANLTDDEKYTKAAKDLAANLKNVARSSNEIFLDDKGEVSLKIAFNVLSFYMNYETKNGGKEHYNDIIAQFNALYVNYFADIVLDLKNGDVSKFADLIYFAAGLIDTLEVMDQALYEIWAKLREFYKETIKAILSSARFILGKDKELDLMLAYAIFKGCRMNLLHTEKYECEAVTLFNYCLNTIDSLEDDDVNVKSAFILAASESVKNREYQDYGRGRGGVLWS